MIGLQRDNYDRAIKIRDKINSVASRALISKYEDVVNINDPEMLLGLLNRVMMKAVYSGCSEIRTALGWNVIGREIDKGARPINILALEKCVGSLSEYRSNEENRSGGQSSLIVLTVYDIKDTSVADPVKTYPMESGIKKNCISRVMAEEAFRSITGIEIPAVDSWKEHLAKMITDFAKDKYNIDSVYASLARLMISDFVSSYLSDTAVANNKDRIADKIGTFEDFGKLERIYDVALAWVLECQRLAGNRIPMLESEMVRLERCDRVLSLIESYEALLKERNGGI